MSFTTKAWKNIPDHSTPVSASSLVDLETRLAAYTDESAPTFYAKLYGAKGDGVTDDYTAIAAAITAASSAGGGVVSLPSGTFIVGTTLTLPSNVRIVGAGWVITSIKAKSTLTGGVLEGENYGSTGIKNSAIEHLTIDGDKANTTGLFGIKYAGKSVYLNKVIVRRCDSHGFSSKIVEGELEVSGLDNFLGSCRAIDCEGKGFNIEAHDTTLFDCQAIQCKEYGFYWTVNGYMIQCHSWCYDSSVETATKTGYRLATSVHCVNCIAEGATERQVEIVGNVVRWFGGEVFDGESAPNVPLFEFNGGTSALIDGAWCHEFGTGGAFKFTTNGQSSTIRANVFDTGGAAAGVGSPHEDVQWDLVLGGTTTLGTASYSKRRQLTLRKIAPGSTIPNNTLFMNEETGLPAWKNNSGEVKKVKIE